MIFQKLVAPMVFLNLITLLLYAYVAIRGAVFLARRTACRSTDKALVATLASTSSLFVIGGLLTWVIRGTLAGVPHPEDGVWVGFVVFNGVLYLSLIQSLTGHYVCRTGESGERPPGGSRRGRIPRYRD